MGGFGVATGSDLFFKGVYPFKRLAMEVSPLEVASAPFAATLLVA